MPSPQEIFNAMLVRDPVHGQAFRTMRLRPPELVRLSFKATAAYLGVTVRTLRRWEAAGKMPERIKVGREQRYRLLDI